MTLNPRVSNGHRRRQLRARVLREEHDCALCGQEVDKTLTTPDPWSAEVDEIVPVSRGGNPLDRTNTQLAHRICNQRKGAGDDLPGYDDHRDCGTPDGQHCGHCRGIHHPRPGVAFETSRTW